MSPHKLQSMLEAASRHLAARRFDAAKAICEPLCRETPHAEACYLMSRILVGEGSVSDALYYARRAVGIKPDWYDAWMMISGLAGMLEKLDVAEHAARTAIRLDPSVAGGFINLGHALAGKQDVSGAIACYRKALRLDSSLERVRYRIESLGGNAVPARAPDEYISGLFDAYASNFDAHLTRQLAYRTPVHVMNALGAFVDTAAGNLDILDLGCGTGLCGQLLRPASRRLVGVDLSPGMLQEARKKVLYDELHEREVTAYLRECGCLFDVITAADLLVYMGDLSALFAAVSAALKAHGLFALSVESAGVTDGYELCRTGRYRHSPAYLRFSSEAAELAILKTEQVVLREESGSPVQGVVAILGKAC